MRRACVAAVLAIGSLIAPAAEDRDLRIPATGDLRGYLVKLARPAAVDDADAARLLEQILGRGWEVMPTAIPGERRVVPAASEARRRVATMTFGAAWERVHQLRSSGMFTRAEPLFTSALQTLEAQDLPIGECAPEWSGTWKMPPDGDLAVKDSKWSLGPHGANVVAAWELFAAQNRTPGVGVVVGHPDTGYRPHPTLGKALLGKGFDFTANRSDALDVSDDGKLQSPGHGTRTGSVIAGGLDYRVTANGVRAVSGVAPGARLMPLKVAHRVVLFDRIDLDMGSLASAIHAASIGDPNYVTQKAQVISISLGGAPSRSVQEAVATARVHNVIVIAAAGNHVPRLFFGRGRREVVWPARYPEVSAIAASNASEKPWDGTSEGSKVSVSAPGQSVWVASQNREGEVLYDCVQMSTGTSYATATTAGIAALWLSYRSEDLESFQLGDVPATFDRLLRDTARNPGSWNHSRHGAGIVDAKRLLEATIVKSAPVASRARCEDYLAIASLFESNGERRAIDLLHGSRARTGEGCADVGHLGDEIAQLFAFEGGVAAAVDDVNRTGSTGSMMSLRAELRRYDISPTLRLALDRPSSID